MKLLENYILKLGMAGLIIFMMSDILPGSVQQASIRSYELDIEVYPEARIDYAGFIEIMEGQRPHWNKADSLANYPYMKGRATMEIALENQGRDGLDFFIHGELRAHKMRMNGRDIPFTQRRVHYHYSYSLNATMVSVKLEGQTGIQRFEMDYAGVFNPSYAGAPSNYMRIDSTGAYLRAYGYSLWFPILQKSGDDSQLVDFNRVEIKTALKYSAVFTGHRISEKPIAGEQMRVSHWQAKAVDLFDAGLTIRPFVLNRDKGVFLFHLNHPESVRASRDIRIFVDRLLNFYRDHYKPIQNTAQVHIAELPNFASGVSHGNMIGITSGQWRRFDLNSQDMKMALLVSHELVHAFVHPKIGLKRPLAALFIEGFPSYFHLNALATLSGESWYQSFMQSVEKQYLRRKQTGIDGRGSLLPKEKPILEITFDEIGRYKDRFILNDRALLFLHFLRKAMGKRTFKQYTRALCRSRDLDIESFISLTTSFLPGSKGDLNRWLESNEYPKRYHLN